MKRKLQIFVSSTYLDLHSERQAAVDAILRAGHIPAGMELFAAGDTSQLETIFRWIDESDIYMLILGSRYGSVDEASGKSYTQIEYEYAITAGKRFFAVVLSDQAIDRKVRDEGRSIIESDHPQQLAGFRSVVMSKICRIVDDSKDIKLAVHETILQFLRDYSFDGWVSGKDIAAGEEISRELARLTRENSELRAEIQAISSVKQQRVVLNDDFDALLTLLGSEYLIYEQDGIEPVSMTVADWFFEARDELVTGVTNMYNMKPLSSFLFFRLSPKLSVHGLMEDYNKPGVKWRTLKTSKKGNDLLAYMQRNKAEMERNKTPINSTHQEEANADELASGINAGEDALPAKATSSIGRQPRKRERS
jgi:hypothetical protein